MSQRSPRAYEVVADMADMIASVLEHLNVKPRHILAHSAGVYHALFLLNNHLDIFDLSARSSAWPMAGPYVYFVAPWSPVLPTTHPDYYTQYLSLIPTKLIETQHVTVRGPTSRPLSGADPAEGTSVHHNAHGSSHILSLLCGPRRPLGPRPPRLYQAAGLLPGQQYPA